MDSGWREGAVVEEPMRELGKRFLWVAVYAAAMAFLEAVVVVYIRGLLQLSQDQVSLGSYVRVEMGREMATLVMLVVVGWLAGRKGVERLAYGVFAFSVWDMVYYVWLKVLLDWPATLLDWDVLFLVPLRWWGPVLSPVLIAALICVTAVLGMMRLERGRRLGITRTRVLSGTLGVLLVLYVFMADALQALLQGRPDWETLRPSPFRWPLFLMALVLMAWPCLAATWPGRRRGKHSSLSPFSG